MLDSEVLMENLQRAVSHAVWLCSGITVFCRVARAVTFEELSQTEAGKGVSLECIWRKQWSPGRKASAKAWEVTSWSLLLKRAVRLLAQNRLEGWQGQGQENECIEKYYPCEIGRSYLCKTGSLWFTPFTWGLEGHIKETMIRSVLLANRSDLLAKMLSCLC